MHTVLRPAARPPRLPETALRLLPGFLATAVGTLYAAQAVRGRSGGAPPCGLAYPDRVRGPFQPDGTGETPGMATHEIRRRTLALARASLPSAGGPGRVLSAMERLETSTRLDGAADAARAAVRALPLGRARDVLHGRWLGHPVHPLLVQVPIGAWLSAAVLDLLPGERRAARFLIGVGLAGAVPAAVSGWADWAETRRPQLRVGLVHAAAGAAGVALYGTSFVARCRGRHWRGKAWAFCGLAAVGVGGAIGGHLAYRQGAGANHVEDVADLVGPGWHDLGPVAVLPEDRPRLGHVDDVPVVIVCRANGDVSVLAARCSHMGGPLAEGEIVDDCVRCPWHGSAFRLSDGCNATGPATAPQPVFETRIVDGRVHARLAGRPLSAGRQRSAQAPPSAA
ncbi:Rieske (2Fe-2S) protein [Streptomyces sp. NPDC051180]|uniref:Rieske (2Fe-2S) protein n=1 Tax=Streptomyces sp. NPDC051180 TaxID=3155797 RepID=UPI0034506379